MNATRPKPPGTNCGHAGAAVARVYDGRGIIGIMVMVMTTAVTATDGSAASVMVPANDLTVHDQDYAAKDAGVGASSCNNGGLARHCIGRRRLALSAITGGQS